MSNYVSGMSYKTTDGKVINFGLASKKSCVTIASVTSSEKAKAMADFVIPNGETILDEMQTAFNAVPSTGGEIHLCAGTYDFSIYCASVAGGSEANLNIPYNAVTVSGEGAGTVFAHNRNDSYITFINAFNKTGIHVKDIEFMVGDYSRGVGLRNCTYSTVSNCTPVMKNTDAYNGILVSGGAYNKIINNMCIGNEFSTVIRIENSRHCIVEGNLIVGSMEGILISVTKSTDILISGNLLQVEKKDTGVYVDSATTGSVMHNHIVNNNGKAIIGNGANLYVNNQVVTV